LSTEKDFAFSKEAFDNLQDQIGSFLGGASEALEGRHDSLTIVGRQKIAEHWRPELIKIGNAMLRKKPADIRFILEHKLVQEIEGEELAKLYRLALESAKIDNAVQGVYTAETLSKYRTALALEQDASSSGAQIIALTTKNKELAELSNVVPTLRKKRLYDEIAQLTYDDPRFKAINERLGLSLKDLQKGAKAGNMVSFYGAGERTQALNVEGKLAKALGKQEGTLVVKARDRDAVLGEISAQAAKYKRFAPDVADELQLLRKQVKDVFDKGLDPGDALMEELWFLSPESRTLVERMTRQYDKVVTPNDFKSIAKIMSEHLGNEVPILKSFTRFYGRLAEDYLLTAKPKSADFDWKAIGRYYLFGGKRSKELRIPSLLAKQLGIKPGTKVKEELFKRLGWLPESGTLHDIVFGVSDSKTRRMGGKYLKLEIAQLKTLFEVKLFHANKLPKRWTNVPSVNFDGKVIEQNFTQVFEEKLVYKDAFGNWQTNIIQVPQRSSATWWEQVIGADGKMQDIADVSGARTAFGVNANHSNDAIIVKRLHLWGRDNNVSTSTIHDAFFTSASEMLRARDALRSIYAETLSSNPLLQTLAEMRARGLPEELYQKYLTEAIETGLIPVPRRSRVGGRLLTEEDILRKEDIMKRVPPGFKSNFGWYGVG